MNGCTMQIFNIFLQGKQLLWLPVCFYDPVTIIQFSIKEYCKDPTELPQQIKAIQMNTNNIYLIKEIKK